MHGLCTVLVDIPNIKSAEDVHLNSLRTDSPLVMCNVHVYCVERTLYFNRSMILCIGLINNDISAKRISKTRPLPTKTI